MVLKTIHPLLNAELLHAMASMGHGDVLAIVDRNFPAASHAQRLVRLNGVGTTETAKAILTVFPVDTHVMPAAFRMSVVDKPEDVPSVQQEFLNVLEAAEGGPCVLGSLDRFEFYRRSLDAFVVVATGEDHPYGCFLITKGVVATNG